MLRTHAKLSQPAHRAAAVLHGLLFAVPMAVLLWSGIVAIVLVLV